MNQSTKQFLGLFAASALALGAVATAVGQGTGMGPGTGGYPGMMGMGPGGMSGMGPGMGGGSVATTTEQLARTKSALGVTAAQESAWGAYEQAVINQLALMSAHRETMMSGGVPPAGGQRAAMHQEGTQMAQQAAQARQRLYDALTPAQKAKADSLIGGYYGPWGRM